MARLPRPGVLGSAPWRGSLCCVQLLCHAVPILCQDERWHWRRQRCRAVLLAEQCSWWLRRCPACRSPSCAGRCWTTTATLPPSTTPSPTWCALRCAALRRAALCCWRGVSHPCGWWCIGQHTCCPPAASCTAPVEAQHWLGPGAGLCACEMVGSVFHSRSPALAGPSRAARVKQPGDGWQLCAVAAPSADCHGCSSAVELGQRLRSSQAAGVGQGRLRARGRRHCASPLASLVQRAPVVVCAGRYFAESFCWRSHVPLTTALSTLASLCAAPLYPAVRNP